jgi:hypothetical protein
VPGRRRDPASSHEAHEICHGVLFSPAAVPRDRPESRKFLPPWPGPPTADHRIGPPCPGSGACIAAADHRCPDRCRSAAFSARVRGTVFALVRANPGPPLPARSRYETG